MAKVGKLTKLKSVLKKLNSFTKRHNSNVATTVIDQGCHNHLFPVYVGKSRRRYLVTYDVICNPVFRELVDRSSNDEVDSVLTVGCEVVLFEHLLWMLENADHHDGAYYDFVDLAEYYAY